LKGKEESGTPRVSVHSWSQLKLEGISKTHVIGSKVGNIEDLSRNNDPEVVLRKERKEDR